MKRIDKLKKHLKHWQIFLNLQSWDLDIKEVDFKRKDYPQSGDIKVDLRNKSAIVLVSKKETKKDNAIILHELVHLLLWDLDQFAENNIPDKSKDSYFGKLEKTVEDLTQIFLEIDK